MTLSEPEQAKKSTPKDDKRSLATAQPPAPVISLHSQAGVSFQWSSFLKRQPRPEYKKMILSKLYNSIDTTLSRTLGPACGKCPTFGVATTHWVEEDPCFI